MCLFKLYLEYMRESYNAIYQNKIDELKKKIKNQQKELHILNKKIVELKGVDKND